MTSLSNLLQLLLFLTSNLTYWKGPENYGCELKSKAFSCWPIPKWNTVLLSVIIFLAHRCLEDIKLLMRKTADRFSDINTLHKRTILVFKIQYSWKEVIWQLMLLLGLWYSSLMNWLSSFAITQFSESIHQPPTIKSAQLALNFSQLRQGRSFSSIINSKIKEIEQSCIPKQWEQHEIAATPALVSSCLIFSDQGNCAHANSALYSLPTVCFV